MIILDTNVISEAFKPSPNPAVMKWLDAQEPETLFLTTISLAEMLAGIYKMPEGRRRAELSNLVENKTTSAFHNRILSFEIKAVEAFGSVNARAFAVGNPISFADCAIAAIASASGFVLATRNVRDFKGTGIEIFNPWSSEFID
jgi:predicted nucleic acid-binding protein